jgi:plastocyanin
MAGVVLVTACGGSGGDSYGSGPTQQPGNNNPQASATVTTPGRTFSPASVNLARGGAVTWNFTGEPHSVVFDTQGSPAGVTQCESCSNTREFPAAGSFVYHCGVHPGMSGTVAVQ